MKTRGPNPSSLHPTPFHHEPRPAETAVFKAVHTSVSSGFNMPSTCAAAAGKARAGDRCLKRKNLWESGKHMGNMGLEFQNILEWEQIWVNGHWLRKEDGNRAKERGVHWTEVVWSAICESSHQAPIPSHFPVGRNQTVIPLNWIRSVWTRLMGSPHGGAEISPGTGRPPCFRHHFLASWDLKENIYQICPTIMLPSGNLTHGDFP